MLTPDFITALGGFKKNLDLFLRNIDDRLRLNTKFSVKRKFTAFVMGMREVSHFDGEQHIPSTWVALRREIGTGPQQH